jgi:hypothetical protein
MSAVREFQAEGHRQAVHWPFEQVPPETRRATGRIESGRILMQQEHTPQKDCKHTGQITVTDEEWVSGDCLRLDVECEECGRRGSLTVVLDPDVILWDKLAPEAKPIVFTEAERTKLMWLVGKVHAQRMAKLELVPDPDDPPTDPELVQLHGILSKIRRAKK